MAMTDTGAPEALHLGADDLPFVEIGDGNKLKVLHVDEKEGLWIVENIFQAGYEVQKHRHTGPVWGYTTSGAWKYKEYDYVNRAGSFLYEPAGSVHTLTCIEDDTRVWFHMYGVNLNLAADGSSSRSPTAPARWPPTTRCARPRASTARTSSSRNALDAPSAQSAR